MAAYLVWSGLVLIVAPWTAFWERNAFAAMSPVVEALMSSALVRGAVTGIGIVTTLAGLGDLAAAILSRPHAQSPESDAGRPTP